MDRQDRSTRPDRQLDATGLSCPEPVFRARVVLETMMPGQVLEVLADDPLAELDFRAWCQRFGHQLLECGQTEAVLRLHIRKNQSA